MILDRQICSRYLSKEKPQVRPRATMLAVSIFLLMIFTTVVLILITSP